MPKYNSVYCTGHMQKGDPRDLYRGTTCGKWPTVLPQRLMLFANPTPGLDDHGVMQQLIDGQLMQRATGGSWTDNWQAYIQVARDPAESEWVLLRLPIRTAMTVRWRVMCYDARIWPTAVYWWKGPYSTGYNGVSLNPTEYNFYDGFAHHPADAWDVGVNGIWGAYVPWYAMDPVIGAWRYWVLGEREFPPYYGPTD